ncbi:GGDEF domain-containing protein [Williamsia herbipolensis]|uniref:GGDEF domain-containing protein n=1 Tax=Williamsia herbipolensis TaxID=1603258 RepID=A0AAU4K3Z4_9NOCA|nr:GGDEF domain-containing protein [Williamsia herbipolensis]
MHPAPPLHRSRPRFDEASQDVLVHLRRVFPIGTWTVTRFDGERQIYLTVDDTDLGVSAGSAVAWSSAMCQNLTPDGGPLIAHDMRAVPEYAAVIDRTGSPATSYVGFPLAKSDGTLFGSVCGFGRDSLPLDTDTHTELITLLASLLSRILEADLQATAAERALEAAHRHADTDALTGLLNRRGWENMLAVEEARFRRFGDPGAVVVIDLDDLKRTNDTHGHHAGDDHLRRVAALLTSAVDVPAVFARTGGDEYGILIGGSPQRVVGQVVAAIRETLSTNAIPASVGVGRYEPADGLDGAWRRADSAMYLEKSRRRGDIASAS